MSTLKIIATDTALTESLIEVVGRLRARGLGDLRGCPDHAIHSAARAFIGRLKEHLDEAEVLLPALFDMAPESADDIPNIQSEHFMFRVASRNLVSAIAFGENSAAFDTARSLLAELLAHVEGEKALMRRLALSLDPSDLQPFAATRPNPSDPASRTGGESA